MGTAIEQEPHRRELFFRMSRYVCIHGHFYQPPREDPWLETVMPQDTAAPWHDWNARIAAECYARNGASRILDGEGKIAKICNNYSRMSFNIGPTLLAWMEDNAPRCYRSILEADAIGRGRFSGHGPAMAQVYNHVIMPLASRRDKVTQVRWGIADFKRRFDRAPEGMWLGEAAADTETLEVLAENGILFTVLSPYQAEAVRPLWESEWQDVRGGRVDTRHPYLCPLPSGRSISIFFYDGLLSQKIAFGGLLDDGGAFARSLIEAWPDEGRPILSHVATDGESYGHHHTHGDMALAYCLETVDRSHDAQLTVYGEFLALCPPEHAVRIVEGSSWSCAHGVERWRSDCGCSAGTPGYHQKWRAPLRKALDGLRDRLVLLYEEGAKGLLEDPWRARDAYIDLILDRSPENVSRWLRQKAGRALAPAERTRALSLLEMQRAALLMYTSCGWFFDEISRVEPVQIMRYAARAMELAKRLFDEDLEPAFLKVLAEAPSNVPELRDGAKVYELLAKQSQVGMPQLAACHGITSLLDASAMSSSQGRWDMSGQALRLGEAEGSRAFSVGTVRVRSRVTGEEGAFLFAVNHLGGASLLCGVCPELGPREISLEEAERLRALFAPGNERAMVERFGHALYSLRHIPADAQRHALDELLAQDVLRIETSVRELVRDHGQLLELLKSLSVRPPAIFTAAAELALTSDIVRCLEADEPSASDIRRQFELAESWHVQPDDEKLRFAFNATIERLVARLCETPEDTRLMESVSALAEIFMEELGERLDLYGAQDAWYELMRRHRKELRAAGGEDAALHLGRLLGFSDDVLKV